MNRQVGTACSAPTTRWYYDARTKSCQTFTYNGCDGNSNNFINRQECERYCGATSCPYGGEPAKEANGQPRLCGPQTTCPGGYSCITIGQGDTSAVNHCCMTRGEDKLHFPTLIILTIFVATICQQTPNQGTQCGVQLQRYYFNSATRQCSTFTYFGCAGNENNFATVTECNNFCGGAACLAGEAAYMDPNSNRPLQCNPVLANSCPQGYNCRTDALINSNVCCGSTDLGKPYFFLYSQSRLC